MVLSILLLRSSDSALSRDADTAECEEDLFSIYFGIPGSEWLQEVESVRLQRSREADYF